MIVCTFCCMGMIPTMGILLFINSSLQLWQSSVKIFYFSEISVTWKTRIEVYLIFFYYYFFNN